jgi:tetratricopeptide (TPR) repeat protein
MVSFKEAERYGEMAHDSLTMARAEYWMGKMLLDEGRVNEGLSAFRASVNLIENTERDRSIIENALATVFILSSQLDSAELCLQNSLLNAKNSSLDRIERKVLNNYAVLYRIQGKYDQALDYLRIILEGKHLDNTEKTVVYLNFGNTFVSMGQMDSAEVYYQHLDEAVRDVQLKGETKVSAYGALLKFARQQGNDSLALRYYEQHESALFEFMNMRQKQTAYRIQQQYDYEALRNTMNQKLAGNHLVIAVAIGLLLLVLALYLFRSAQASKREARANANLFLFMQQNKALVESNMAQEQRTVDTEQRLSDLLFAKVYAMQQFDYYLKTPKDKGALKDLEREVFGTGDHWEAVKEILMELYPGLWESLKLKYPEMNEMELRVCMLTRLKLSRQGEAALLGISTSVLDKLRAKVRKTMEEA